MLGDDVIDGTKRGIGLVGKAVKNTVKGALLFGAIALAASVGIEMFAAVAGIEGFAGKTVLEAAYTVAAQTWRVASTLVPPAALVGGAVAGVASFLPGSDEMGGIAKFFKRDKKKAKQQAVAQEQTYSHAQEQQAPVRSQDKTATRSNDDQPVYIEVVSPQQQGAAPCHTGYSAQPTTIHNHIDNSYREQRTLTNAPTLTDNSNRSLNIDDHSSRSDANSISVAANETLPNPYYRDGKGMEMKRRGDEREAPAMAK